MLKISIYHWLPLADNMLPDIQVSLKISKSAFIEFVDSELIQYSVEIESGNAQIGKIKLKGRINSRGFSQCIFEFPPMRGETLGAFLSMLIPILQEKVSEFIFDVLPYAVRNKTGVMEEKIYSFQQFESRKFETIVDNISKSFLKHYRTISILIDAEYSQDMNVGFPITILPETLNIYFPNSNQKQSFSLFDENQGIYFFYSENFKNEELQDFDGIIYKYCAIVAYYKFIERGIEILKDVRDHVIPLRRQLAIVLQKNTEEYFVWLTRIKKYLTYINIKLPIVERIKNHLSSAYTLGVANKLHSFESTKDFENYSSIIFLQSYAQKFPPTQLNALITEALERIEKLLTEAKDENKVLSNELSSVMQGSLLSENVQIATRNLDAARSLLEIDRGAKNRSNALKILSVVLSGTLGVSFAKALSDIGSFIVNSSTSGSFFFKFGNILVNYVSFYELSLLILAPVIAWSFTERYIQDKSRILKIIVPITANFPPRQLEAFIESKRPFTRFESTGQRRVISWEQKINLYHQVENFIQNNRSLNFTNSKHSFLVSIDYEKRGYVYSITLENEHDGVTFNELSLIIQILKDLDESGCLVNFNDQDTCLLSEILIQMGIAIEEEGEKFLGMNKVLVSNSIELFNELNIFSKDPSGQMISIEDKEIYQDIFDNLKLYIKWLVKADNDQIELIPLSLLGKKNIKNKLKILCGFLSTNDID